MKNISQAIFLFLLRPLFTNPLLHSGEHRNFHVIIAWRPSVLWAGEVKILQILMVLTVYSLAKGELKPEHEGLVFYY